jgi:hypothetical protein
MKIIICANVRVPQHVNHLRFFVCELVHLMKFEFFVYLTEKKLPFFSFVLLSLSHFWQWKPTKINFFLSFFICYISLFVCNNNIFCNLKQHKKRRRKEGMKEGMDFSSSSSSFLVGLSLPLIISLQCYRICVCCSCQACFTCILIAKP